MVSESKTVAKLLDQFSSEGLEKAKYLISNWEYVYPGQREVLLKEGPKKTDRTRIRICKYKDEYILVKGPIEIGMIDWLVNDLKPRKPINQCPCIGYPWRNLLLMILPPL